MTGLPGSEKQGEEDGECSGVCKSGDDGGTRSAYACVCLWRLCVFMVKTVCLVLIPF